MYNLAIVFFVGLGSLTYGFNDFIMGTVHGLDSFYHYFGLSSTGTRASYITSIIGTVQGIFYAGGIIGCDFVTTLANRRGGRISIQITCAICIISAAIQAASVHIAILLLQREYDQFTHPVVSIRSLSASSRGRMVGSHEFLIVTEYAFAPWTGLGCYFEPDQQIQWRLCLALQIVAPLLLILGSPFFPESPRWLVTRGRKEAALNILVQLHHSTSADYGRDLAHQEFAQIESQIRSESETSLNFLDIVKTPSYRKRFLIAIFVQCLAQSTGVLVVNKYQVMLYNTLGLYGWIPLLLYRIYTTWAAFLNFLGILVLDRVGRITMLSIGMVGCSLSVACEAAMVGKYSDTTNKVGNGFGVLFLFIFVTFYGSCVNAISYVYCAEPMRNRAQGVAASIMSLFAMTLIYTDSAPVAFGQVGWKYYLIFIILPLLRTPLIWFVFLETKGLSLEEVARLFGDEVAGSGVENQYNDKLDMDNSERKEWKE